MNGMSLTAGHTKRAHLSIQRIQFQIHGTGQCKRYSYTVQYGTVGENSNVYIGHDDVVEMSLFLVRKEQVGHPNPASFGQSQIFKTA